MYRGVCICILVYVCVWVYTYVPVCTCGCLACIYIYMYALVASYSDSDPFVRSKLGNRRFGLVLVMDPITKAIQRPIHEMIRRSVPVRVVKTRRRFGSETASFLVSIRSCAFPYLPLWYAFTYYTYHFMWLSVIFYQFDYLYHFMRHLWMFTLIT